MAAPTSPEGLTCRHCHVPAGTPCLRPDGWPAAAPHKPRVTDFEEQVARAERAATVLRWAVDEHEDTVVYALLEGEEIAYIEELPLTHKFVVEIYDGGMTENSQRLFDTKEVAMDHLERLARLVMAGGGE